jgi:sarcosine oxidase, subunit beta
VNKVKTAAAAVVIGGGVNGCSIAYQLARKGYKDVVIVEKDQVCSAASCRCPGGFRCQWATEADILLMAESIRMFTGLQEELQYPHDLEVRQIGYMFLIYSEEDLEQYRKNVRLQKSLGIPVSLMTPQEAKERVPSLKTDGMLGATFCPWDGRAGPWPVTHAYAEAARRLGVEIYTNTRVTGLTTSDSKITSVITDRGPIDTSVVVCVAGVHSPTVARMVGIEDVPIKPVQREGLITERVVREDVPVLMAPWAGYFQTPNGDVFPSLRDPERVTFDPRPTRGFLERSARAWMRIMPIHGNVRVLRAWAGTYDMSPDAHPIVGQMPGIEGFYMAAGFSGHGFMMTPVVGKTMAEIILGESHSIDVSALRPERFADGAQVVEKMVY